MTTGPWVVFAIANAAVFLVSVDATIAVAAFPALRSSFSETSPATRSWVLNACTILYAALLVPARRLVDLHGSRRLFLFGVTLFTLASAVCGLAAGTSTLIAARTVQAVGGAVLTPASLALILGAFPADKRSAIVGLWSAAGALGAAVGPGAGAILIELASWRAAFLVNLPFGALILWFAARRLPTLKGADAGEGLDLPGIALIVDGAVNNAVRQVGGVFGTALAVVLVGQTGAGLEVFRLAYLCLGLFGLAVAVLYLPLPRQSGRIAPLTAG